MRLTRISKQAKRERYNLFSDDQFVGAVSANVLAQAGLREGDELDPGQLDELLEQDQYGKVLAKAYDLLGRRPHSRSELQLKLDRKDYDPELTAEALDHLTELGYLDDTEFARRWVAERGGQRGAALLRAELRRKGVADEAVEAALHGYHEEHDVLLEAETLARKKLKSLAGKATGRELEAKLTRYLSGRGYDFETIRQIWQRING